MDALGFSSRGPIPPCVWFALPRHRGSLLTQRLLLSLPQHVYLLSTPYPSYIGYKNVFSHHSISISAVHPYRRKKKRGDRVMRTGSRQLLKRPRSKRKYVRVKKKRKRTGGERKGEGERDDGSHASVTAGKVDGDGVDGAAGCGKSWVMVVDGDGEDAVQKRLPCDGDVVEGWSFERSAWELDAKKPRFAWAVR
nr:hypothetical protein Iba_chr05dCG6450 [Ipomoea batatas]